VFGGAAGSSAVSRHRSCLHWRKCNAVLRRTILRMRTFGHSAAIAACWLGLSESLEPFGLSSNALFVKNRGVGTILNDD